MKAKYKRLLFLSTLLTFFTFGCLILFFNLRDNLVFFYSPSEIIQRKIEINKKMRVGGLVKKNSLKKKLIISNKKKVEEIHFVITDLKKEINVLYIGILPDLFKEGQGVVVEGILKNSKIFNAKKVLAKHDEKYMPPEIKDLTKKELK
mgnify:CR=1 FL=1